MPIVLHVLIEDRGLDTFPSVYNALYLWKNQGWSNDIATACDCDDFMQFIDRVYPLKPGCRVLPAARDLSQISRHYDLIITYEPKDLEAYYIAGLLGGKRKGSRHLHHSLEIPSFAFEGNGLKKLFHRLVLRKAMGEVDLFAIQDRLRYKILCSYFPVINGKPFSIVPNSFLDAVEPMVEKLLWFDKIRKDAKTLILYIGGIERWALSTELMDEIAALPAYTFLFSGWSREGYHKELAGTYAQHGHIVFDVRKKSRAELNYMVSHSDIGLAIYNSTDINVSHTGLSSGKFFKYIQHNKPVIINDIPLLNSLVSRNGMGTVYTKGNLGRNISAVMQGGKYPQSLRNKLSFEHFYKRTIKLVNVAE